MAVKTETEGETETVSDVAVNIYLSLQCFDVVGWGYRKGIRPVKCVAPAIPKVLRETFPYMA